MKYIITILLTLLSLSSFGQTDTTDVCMPYSVAKKIAQDLVVGDSAQELLSAVVEQLELTENKVILKDSIINNLKNKEFNLMDQVRNEKMAKEAYITMYNTLEGEYTRVYKQYKKQKFINRIYKVGFWSGLAIGIAGYIILTKPF
jgi:hypothetical protein